MNRALILVALLAGCSVQSQPPAAPSHSVEVLSVSCDPNHGRARAEVAVRNNGQTTIEWPKAMISFGGVVTSSHLRPNPLRPGGMATATAYAERGNGSSSCQLVGVQDGDGYSVNFFRQ